MRDLRQQCRSPGWISTPCRRQQACCLGVELQSSGTASFINHQIIPTALYNSFAGDTRVQPNGDIEYDLSGVNADSFVLEVTPTATPQVVWQMHIIGDNTYRAFRKPSLYPGVQW